MISNWEYTLNKRVGDMEENIVTLDSILVKVKKQGNQFKLNPAYKTIRYIEEKEYRQDLKSRRIRRQICVYRQAI